MTLIIGAKCADGYMLVADTKVTDMDATDHIWENKIYLPLPNVAVCAAGYADLFKEFNRKITLKVEERQREYYVENISALRRAGVSDEKIKEILTPKRSQAAEKEFTQPTITEKATDDPLPIPALHIYTAEYFLDVE